jgi:hypothetical protein
MYKFILLFLLVSFIGVASDNKVIYGYDKQSHQIYARIGEQTESIPFYENYNDNPSIQFGYFNAKPAIIISGESLHDYSVYATFNYHNQGFYIDCIYSDMKSKQNGISSKEGICGLNFSLLKDYKIFVESIIESTFKNIDMVNTSYFLSGKTDYLPILLFRNNNYYVYKLYTSKENMLDDKYHILSIDDKNQCLSYRNKTWTIYEQSNDNIIFLESEKNDGKNIYLDKLPLNDNYHNDDCLSFPIFRVKENKSFFYDEENNQKKSYLIKNDKFTLLSLSENRKWCEVQYLNINNKKLYGKLLCSTLNL